MSEAFEKALGSHLYQSVNYSEFRLVWQPVWMNIARSAEQYFPMHNQQVPNLVVAALLTGNATIGQDLLGRTGYNAFLSVVNDATTKFNQRATTIDPLAGKVHAALVQTINEGHIE